MLHEAFLITLPFPQQPSVSQGTPTTTQAGASPASGNPSGGNISESTQQPAGGPAGLEQMCSGQTALMMGGFLVLMYFMVLGPERKRRKQTESMLAALKNGDRVVTLGGMHGVVSQVGEKSVTIRIDQQKFVFDRSAIARVERDEPEGKKP
ncbi:hypothetical protein LBMAG49_19860 [Planctomycetota bacterium]|jgi:preprotein translocase subunit YajC|nr:hypothetical protein LBMAG49_19860 [Planctomycetota bacterium]